MNGTLGAPTPDDERTVTDEFEAWGDHRQDSQMGWPLGAVAVVVLIAVLTNMISHDLVLSMLLAGLGGGAVVVLDQLSD